VAAPDIVAWIGIGLLGLGTLVLWRAHRSKDTPIDFAHLLVDVKGKTSLRKCGEALALLASTWVVLWMASLKTLTETIFLGYVLIWAARSAIGPLVAARAGSITTRALSASRVDNPDG
jgi:hypothetical protein